MDPVDQAHGISVLHLGEFMLKCNNTVVPHFLFVCESFAGHERPIKT